MDFHTIEIEDDLDELSAEEATELLAKFQKAQEANKEQFEDVTEKVEEFSALDSEVTEDLVDASPLGEDEVSAMKFSRKRELLAEFSESDEAPEGDGGDEGDNGDEGGPASFGKQGATHGDDGEEGTPEFVEDAFESINGVTL